LFGLLNAFKGWIEGDHQDDDHGEVVHGKSERPGGGEL
jgi:hypothetical protein